MESKLSIMRKILLLILGCITLMSCDPSKSKMEAATRAVTTGACLVPAHTKENLKLSVEYPKQIKIIAVKLVLLSEIRIKVCRIILRTFASELK